jgi:hypothetical protein
VRGCVAVAKPSVSKCAKDVAAPVVTVPQLRTSLGGGC